MSFNLADNPEEAAVQVLFQKVEDSTLVPEYRMMIFHFKFIHLPGVAVGAIASDKLQCFLDTILEAPLVDLEGHRLGGSQVGVFRKWLFHEVSQELAILKLCDQYKLFILCISSSV